MKDSRKDSKGRVLKDGESQRKDGSYEYKGADGRRHSVYAGTLKELREKRKQAEKNVEDGILFVNQNILLNDVFDIYFSGKTELKESTRSNYKYMNDKFVRMKFGMRKISLIKYSDIREFYNYLINDLSFKPNSLEIIHSLLHPTFTLAVRDGYIRCNPSDGLKGDIKKSHCWEKPQRHALTEAEQAAFVQFQPRRFIATGCHCLHFCLERDVGLVKRLVFDGMIVILRIMRFSSTIMLFTVSVTTMVGGSVLQRPKRTLAIV